MNWHLAIEKNHEALRRIVAMLVAMVGMTTGGNGGSNGDRPSTLPRHLHRFVLRLLRPAEAATRRLIIVAARGLAVRLPEPRVPNGERGAPRPDPRTVPEWARLRLEHGLPIEFPRGEPIPLWARETAGREEPVRRPRGPLFQMFDPMRRFDRNPEADFPAVSPDVAFLDEDGLPVPVQLQRPASPPTVPPHPPTPDDPLDAARIHRRLEALGRALEDLPGQAKRIARWQARRDARLAAERASDPELSRSRSFAPPSVLPDISPTRGEISSFGAAANLPPFGGDVRQDRGGQRRARHAENAAQTKPRFQRLSPIRPGHPPGWRRKPNHDVYNILNELHGLAVRAREQPDTS